MTQNNRQCDYCGCAWTDRPLDQDPVVVKLGMPDKTIFSGLWCRWEHYTRWCENYRLRTATDDQGNPLGLVVDDPGEMVAPQMGV